MSDYYALLFYARETVADVLAKAFKLWPSLPMSCFVKIELGIRGACAGRAYYSQNKIKLNEQLFRENEDDFIRNTIPHEVAHLISFALHGANGRGHGRHWREVMRKLGVEDSARCHFYHTTPARKVRFFPMSCACASGCNVSSIVANRIKRGYAYRCKRCKQTLVTSIVAPEGRSVN